MIALIAATGLGMQFAAGPGHEGRMSERTDHRVWVASGLAET